MLPDRRWTTGSQCALRDEGLHEAVARIARRFPEAVALASDGRALTYTELDRIAGAWAARLAAAGVRRGSRVPVLLPRGEDLVIAFLAVLKAGGAYAPLDPAWPADRLKGIVGQLDAPLLIASPGTGDSIGPPVWWPPAGSVAAPAGFRPVSARGSDPCCVFFTSGTTGQPKGVLSPHRATARLFQGDGFARFAADTVMPLAAPTPWDAFSLELWSMLLNGGTCVIISEPYLSAESLRRAIRERGVNATWLTNSLFNMIVDEDLGAFSGLDQVIIGGERLSSSHVRRFLSAFPRIALLNGYGPVEATVFATTHRITAADCERPGGIPLGRPVPRTRVLVLNGSSACHVEATGEVCIAGDGLALCYLGDAELTEEKFTYVEVDGAPLRIYRTGDLGWWDSEGLLHFQGRADRQLKIAGHRVEPAEVEQQIAALLPSVRSCRVVARRDETGAVAGLVAFCVPNTPGDLLRDALPALRSALVTYQCPEAVVSIGRFPLTTQGKLDERALLARARPDEDDPAAGGQLGDPAVRLVMDAFAVVLGRAGIPADVPFFELGGTSLGAGRVCARLGAWLSSPVPVSWLYQHPSAAALADRLRADRPTSDAPRPGEGTEACLTPMQLVYLTQHLVSPADLTGHCLLTWLIEGDLDRAALRSAIGAVHRKHEPLRAAYVADPRPAARLVRVPAPELEVFSGRASAAEAIGALRSGLARALRPMDGEIWRAALVPVGSGSVAVLGCIVHHIAFDGWSESVLTHDLATSYNVAVGAAAEPFAEPPPSLAACYQEYAARLARADVTAHHDYLASELTGVPELRWPAKPTAQQKGQPGHLAVTLPPDLISWVDATAAELGVSRFVVLLAGWGRSLAEVSGQDDFAVGVPVAQRHSAALERAVGCHINMLAIRLRGAALGAWRAAVRECGRIAARAFVAQDVPFADVLRLAGPYATGRNPLFQVLFAVQDNDVARLDLSGLRTTFVRQPYLHLPLELHGELWPEPGDGMRLVVSYRPDQVPVGIARDCAERFVAWLCAARADSRL